MSMTIQNTPANCANDAIYFVVSSTNTAQSNFKYIADVYVGGVQRARLKGFPDPETGGSKYGIFEVSRVVKDYLTTYFDPQDGTELFSFSSGIPNQHIKVDYEIKFGEEYGGSAYYDQVSGGYAAFNYYKPLFQDIKANDNITDYDNKFLTDRDITKVEAEFNAPLFISFFNKDADTVSSVEVTRYSEGWQSISTTSYSISDAAIFQMYNICPFAINQTFSNLIQFSDYGYGVKLKYSSTLYTSEIKVKINCSNLKGTTIPLTFLNRLGGYDTLNFSLVNRERLQIEDKTFKKTQWRYGSNDMSNTTQAGFIPSTVKYSAKHTNSILLRSDYLTEKDYNWLRDLVATTEAHICYRKDALNTWQFYPVIIKTLNWEQKYSKADKMFNLEIEVEVATEIYSQFK